jgi:pimeloyl-ACP methyl ester carboxylesterase
VQPEQWQAAVRRVRMSHGDAAVAEFGSGEPVILLHGVGFTQGGHDWFRNVEELARDFRVVAPDLVGWGAGSRLRQGYSFARLADFVRELQDCLDIPRSHLVGHSMGGWIASLLAYESPSRVDRLVLVGAGGAATRPLPTMTEFQPPSLEDVQTLLAARSGLGEEVVRPWAEYSYQKVQDPEALASYRRILAHMSDPETRGLYNMLRRYPYISAQTLVLWGEADQVNTLALGQEAARLIPDADLTVMECGHFPHSERPEEFNRRVGAFLAQGRTD